MKPAVKQIAHLSLIFLLLSGWSAQAQDSLEQEMRTLYSEAYSDPDRAVQIARSIRNEAIRADNDSLVAWSHYAEGAIAYLQGEYAASLKHHLVASRMYTDQGMDQGYADCQYSLALIDKQLERYSSAIDRLTNYIRIMRQDSMPMARASTLLGTCFMMAGEKDSAFFHLQHALAIKRAKSDSASMSFTLGGLADVYLKFGMLPQADSVALAAFAISKHLNITTNIADLLCIRAEIALQQEATDSAIHRARAAIMVAQTANYPSARKDAYHTLSIAHESREEYGLAHAYLLKYHALRDSLVGTRAIASIGVLENSYQEEMERRRMLDKEMEIERVSSAARLSRQRNLFIISCCIALLALALWGLNHFRLRSQKRALELEMERTQRSLTQKELEKKKKELLTHTMSMARNMRTLEQLKDSLSNEESSQSNRIRWQINKLMDNSSDWEEFNRRLLQVSPEFYSRLRASYPDLTDGEHRLAALVSMNLSSKQVAELLAVEHSSVNMARYRLRKKLELKEGDSLYQYLNSFHVFPEKVPE